MTELPWAGRQDALPEEVAQALSLGARIHVLDVRTAGEYAAYHIPGARLVPVNELAGRLQSLDPDEHWVVVCEHGVRSRAASQYLLQMGFGNVTNMVGGMSRWAGPVEQGLPSSAP